MKRLLHWTLPLVLIGCAEPPPAPLNPTAPSSTTAPQSRTNKPQPEEEAAIPVPPEAPAEPGQLGVPLEELELAIDMVRAQTGGPVQIPNKPEMSPTEIDALLYRIAMDPEASAIYAHETSPRAAEPDPPGMDREPIARER